MEKIEGHAEGNQREGDRDSSYTGERRAGEMEVGGQGENGRERDRALNGE